MGNYDNDKAFEAVLQNTGQNIEAFIDEFFGFLARRSDFFVVSPPEGSRVGFPPGVAAKLVISKFKKWEEYRNKKKNAPTPPMVPLAAQEAPEARTMVEVPNKVKENGSTSVASENKVEKKSASCDSTASKTSKKTEPVTKKKDKQAHGLSDSYNGRKTDKYSWSQSIKELDIYIAVGKDVQTKKQVKVEIHMNKIRVVVTGSEVVTTDWQLSNPIVKDESYWSLHPGESIFLSLQKVREMWWDHLFEGEERIDRTKIEAVRPMEDLAEEEQAKIQEVIFNQEQKLKGLPTSEELKMEEVMKKAWDAEGSPFKGQPFDMSRIQLSTNTVNIPGQDEPPSS